MSTIFNYLDYRQFLADYYKEKKKQSPQFSYQSFSQKAGFSSKSFVFNVIKGKKTLSRTSVVKMCGVIGFSKTEAAYFENLVYFNQAINYTERNYYFEKLNATHPVTPVASKARKLRSDQYDFYSQWYHVVVRSLIDLYPDETDPYFFAKKINPPVTMKQVQKSIELLQRLGLIVQGKSGKYKVTDKIISTGEDMQSLAVQQFHLTSMEHAQKALKEMQREKRNVSGLTLGISEKSYNIICDEIDAFQEKLLSIAESDTESDEVFQLNFQFFPVTKKVKSRKTSSGKNGGNSYNKEQLQNNSRIEKTEEL